MNANCLGRRRSELSPSTTCLKTAINTSDSLSHVDLIVRGGELFEGSKIHAKPDYLTVKSGVEDGHVSTMRLRFSGATVEIWSDETDSTNSA